MATRKAGQAKSVKVATRYNKATVSGWQYTNKSALDIINEYQKKIKNGEWMSSEDRTRYKSAIDDYTATGNSLRKASGKRYTSQEEKSWQDSLSSLSKGYDTAESFYGQFASDTAYGAWKERMAKEAAEEEKKKAWQSQIDNADAIKGGEGYQAYLDSSTPKTSEDSSDRTWWDKVMDFGESIAPYVFQYQATANDNPANVAFNTAVYNYQNDDSYMRPRSDWSDQQRYAFGQLYLESPAKAFAFAEETNNRIDRAKEESQIASIEQWATKNGWNGALGTAGSILAAPYAWVDTFNDLAKIAAGREITKDNNYDGFVSPGEWSSAVQGGISSKLNEDYGTVDMGLLGERGWGDAYGLATSIAESMTYGKASKWAGTGAVTGLTYFGKALSQGFDDAVARGADQNTAMLYGAAMGAIEAVTEKIGLDNFMKIKDAKTKKALIMGVLKQVVSEGGEEGLSSLASTVVDGAMMGENSNLDAEYSYLLEAGLDEKTARWTVIKNALGDAVFDTIGGMISGGVAGGAETLMQTSAENRISKKYFSNKAQAMVDEAKASNNPSAVALGEKLGEKLDSGKKLSGWNLNQLLDVTDTGKIKSAVEARLSELGERGNISAIADAITKEAKGGELTRGEQKLIEGSDFGRSVSLEISRESLTKNQEMNRWAENIGTRRVGADIYNPTATPVQTVEEKSTPAMKEHKVEVTAKNSKGKTIKGEIRGIQINGGKVSYNLSDGSTVRADKVSFATENEALVAKIAAERAARGDGFTTEAAMAMMKGYDGSVGVSDYVTTFNEAMKFGAQGGDIQSAVSLGESRGIDNGLVYAAYAIGQKNSPTVLKSDGNNAIINTESEDFINEGKNAEGIYLRDGGERSGGANPEGQVSSVEGGPGKTATWREGSRVADSEASRLIDEGRRVKVSNLGISGGSAERTVVLLDKQNETASMKKGREILESDGMTVRYFAGDNLLYTDKYGKEVEARAFVLGNQVFIRADHPLYTADQLARHEDGHGLLNKLSEADRKKVLNDVRKRLVSIVGKENIDAVAKHYAEAYEGTDYDADEIWEECICDSLGDMNIFSKRVARELMAELLPEIKSVADNTIRERTDNQTRGSPTSTEGKASREMSDEDYYNYGWVRDNNIISAGHWKTFTTNFADALKRNYKFNKTPDGEFMIEAYNYYDPESEADVVVFAKGTIESPVVTKIIKINSTNHDVIEDTRRDIYAIERRGIHSKAGDILRIHSAVDFVGIGNKRGDGYKNARNNNQLGAKRSRSEIKANPIVKFHVDEDRGTVTTTYKNGETITENLNSGKASREIDAEYLSAVERGDMETAQRMVDEAAKGAGYNEHLYHGTNADFTKFDLRKYGGRNGKGEGYGIYLAANREISAPYGKNVIDSFVKFNRLAEGRKKTISHNEVKNLVKRSCEIEAQRMVDDEGYDSTSEALKDTWVSNIVYTYGYSNMEQVYTDVANKLWKENDNDGDLINEIMALSGAHYDYNNALDFYDNILTPITGIDGFHYIWGNKDGSGEQNDIYLALRSEQVKSADPVTYDDDGNVIPLSERFNPENKDIRYSRELDFIDYLNEEVDDDLAKAHTKADESMMNRLHLINALESITDYPSERGVLNDYRAMVETIAGSEKRIADIDADIKALSKNAEANAQVIKMLKAEKNTLETEVSKADERLLSLESTKTLRGVLERERTKAYKSAKQEGYEALKAQRAKSDAKLEALKEYYRGKLDEKRIKANEKLDATVKRYQEARAKGIEGRHKTAERHSIRKIAKDLEKLLNRGTKERNVKKGERALVERLLDITDRLFATDDELLLSGIVTDTSSKEKSAIAEYMALYEEYHSYDDAASENKEIRKELRQKMTEVKHDFAEALERERNRINEAQASDAFDALIKEYEKLSEAKESYIKDAFDSETLGHLKYLKQSVGNATIKDMSLEQLKNLHKALTMVKSTIQNSNKIFSSPDASVEQMGADTESEIKKHGHKKKFSSIGKGYSKISWNNLKPIYLLERTGSKTLMKLGQAIFNAESKWATDMSEAKAFNLSAKNKYGFKGWNLDKSYTFKNDTGQTYKLNLKQIMSVYAYSKRGEQALNHLRTDGFVFDRVKVKERNKWGIPTEYELNDSTAYKITDKNLVEMINKLSANQRAYVDEMQKYLSETMGAKGNEVSMQLYGIDLFGEENYFPIRSEGAYLERVRQQKKGETKIKNKGFTKPTQEGAKNPIVLSEFGKVWSEHVSEMSSYHAFTLPLEDFYKVFNYSNPSDTEVNKTGVIPALKNAYGEASVEAIDQLLSDLNGGARSDARESLAKQTLTSFKKAKTMLSLSVVIQQPSAKLRAQAMIDAKYFVGKKIGDTERRNTWEEIKKYAPVAIIKDMGHFDVGMGKSSAEWLLDEGDWKDKLDDILSKPASKADELAWCDIWNAVKRETASNNPKLSTSSEAFLKKAGERFEDVIRHTQVYDSTLAKSSYMRSKSVYMQMAMAFMAEPTTSINMREMALRSGDKKRILKTTAAVYASTLLNALLVAIPYAMRDDDEDETFIEKYVTALSSSFINSINPITSLPFIKDAWSILQGYDVERTDMSLADDLVTSLKKLVTTLDDETVDKKKVVDAVLGIIGDLSALTGIPVANVIRDAKSVINAAKTITKDVKGRDTTWDSISDALEGMIRDETPVVGWLPGENKNKKLYDATMTGDEAYVDRLRDTYSDYDSYKTALRKALRENDPRIKEAAEALNKGDKEAYESILAEIVDEGHFDEAIIEGAIDAEATAGYNDLRDDSRIKESAMAFLLGNEAKRIELEKSVLAEGEYKADIIYKARKAEADYVKTRLTEAKEYIKKGKPEEAEAIYKSLINKGYTREFIDAYIQKIK